MSFLQTFTGLKVRPWKMTREDVNIMDIAHSLSNLCRFAGHTRKFYSVAQHSLIVSNLVPEEFALLGLLHDAAEAYLVDMPTPVKEQLPAYRELETIVWEAIADKYHLPLTMPFEVRAADRAALEWEAVSFINGGFDGWGIWGVEESIKSKEPIIPAGPGEAEQTFIERFRKLAMVTA